MKASRTRDYMLVVPFILTALTAALIGFCCYLVGAAIKAAWGFIHG